MAGANSNTAQHVLEVKSLAALSEVHVAELDFGARAFVDALQLSYYLHDNGSLVPNGTTIIMPVPGAIPGKPSARWVVESSGGGGGNLVIENNQIPILPTRTALNFDNRFFGADDPGNLSTDIKLRTGEPYVSQTDWYIDPVNGDDTHLGTIGAPLKTLTEWSYRMGQTSIQIAMNVHVLSDLNAGDIPMGPINVAAGGVLTIEAVPTVVQSSAFTAVTAAIPSTNAPWSATAAAVNWAAVMAAGQRIRMTAGASTGAIAWPMLDHGGGAADFSWPQTADATLGPFGQSQQTLTANTFNVEQLVKLGGFALRVHVPAGGTFQIIDCDVGGASYSLDNDTSQSSLYGCQIQGSVSDNGACYINCGSTTDVNHSSGASIVIFGGLVLGSVFIESSGFLSIDFDFAIQGGNLQIFNTGEFVAGRVQIFNWPGGASGAGGVQLWQLSRLTVQPFTAATKRIWGSSAGAGTVGFRIESGSIVEYDTDVGGLGIVGTVATPIILGSSGTAINYGSLPFYLGLSSLARRQVADQPNATAVLAPATNLIFPGNANGEFFVSISATLTVDNTGAAGFSVQASVASLGTFAYQYLSTVPKSGNVGINVRVDQTVGAPGELVTLLISGTLKVSASNGNVQLYFASVGAGTTTLKANSGIQSVRNDPAGEFAGMILE